VAIEIWQVDTARSEISFKLRYLVMAAIGGRAVRRTGMNRMRRREWHASCRDPASRAPLSKPTRCAGGCGP